MNNLLNYDSVAKGYDQRYTSKMSERENEAIGSLLDVMLECYNGYVPPRIIDIGCGTGFAIDVTRHPIDKKRYTGIDVSQGMIDGAKKKYPEYEFIQGNINELELIENNYGIALSLFSIPYIGIDSVQRVYDLLKNGGVYITVYYNKPYKNRDSVYWNKQKHFMKEVKPKVDEIIEKLKNTFEEYQQYYLTPDKTYILGIFRKGSVK